MGVGGGGSRGVALSTALTYMTYDKCTGGSEGRER